MVRTLPIAVVCILTLSTPARAQEEWRPPARQMPDMPSAAQTAGDWLGPRAAWFAGIEAATGASPDALTAAGEPPRASPARVVRFLDGPLPVVIWSDRNGDGRADLIEVYRAGGVVAQLIDADYDGNANVIRRYDGDGSLIREDRM